MKESKETIRTFIAIQLTQDIHDKLKRLQSDLAPSMPDVRWTKYGNIHLTLKFLGDIQISRVDKIVDSLKEIAAQSSPFTMNLTGVGAFPNCRKPRIVWVGTEKGTDELIKLAKSVEFSMKKLGFPREKRPFRPHLTVGRIRTLKKPDITTKALEQCSVGKIGDMPVERLSFVKSQLNPAGSIYTSLAELPLGQNK
jgi:2'-5' RNA ligase